MLTPIFFFTDTATTQIYTLSLHDALPIYALGRVSRAVSDALAGDYPAALAALDEAGRAPEPGDAAARLLVLLNRAQDRKSTRLNSSHPSISYAVFCLKKKKSCAYPTYLRT